MYSITGLCRIYFLTLVIFIAVFPVSGAGAAENPAVYTQNAEHSVNVSIDKGKEFLLSSTGSRDGSNPIIMTVVSEDGSISVCDATSTTTYVYEYTGGLKYIKTMKFTNEFALFGGFTKDREGSYYFFYGKEELEEHEMDAENMALAKYDSSGKKLHTLKIKASDTRIMRDLRFSPYLGVKQPFRYGARRLEISGSQLIVYFARLMFIDPEKINHQGSIGFIVDKDSFKLESINVPSISHSMNQFVLPVENGFVAVNQGDGKSLGGVRRFVFSQYDRKGDLQSFSTSMAFSFKIDRAWDEMGEYFYNYTFAQLGGIAESPNGFIFAGTYEKNGIAKAVHNDSRNLLLLTMKGIGIDEDVSPPMWITDYKNKDTENAANPKIVAVSDNHFLLMWELFTKNSYKTTYMAIIDGAGKLLTKIIEMPKVRLNINDVPRYNRSTGNVHWAIDNGKNKFDIYSFNPSSFAKINIPPFKPRIYKETNPLKIPIDSKTPDGGYGLVLRRFEPGLTSAIPEELFDIKCTFENPTADVFKGHHFGAGLFDDKGNLVEIISVHRPTSPMERREQAHFTIKDNKVSNAVKPGNYRLRLLVLPDGLDWRIASVPYQTTPTEIAFTVKTIGKETTPVEVAVPITNTAPLVKVTAGTYGLTLEKMTVDKTSVSQNELLRVTPTIRNTGLDTFPGGQIGGALENSNGDMVEIIGISNFDSLKSGSNRSNRVVYCAIPNTVKPGQYRLRMLTRATGGEWSAAMTSSNAVSITVTAGEAMIGAYGMALMQFSVSGKVSEVTHGKKFSLSAKAVKVGVSAFPGGQIGVALVTHNGTIAEVIYTDNWKALDPGSEISQNINNISVPNSVAPGKYKLRMVVRQQGGEWKIVTMSVGSVSNSIDLTVL
jgi:hypothetical protein